MKKLLVIFLYIILLSCVANQDDKKNDLITKIRKDTLPIKKEIRTIDSSDYSIEYCLPAKTKSFIELQVLKEFNPLSVLFFPLDTLNNYNITLLHLEEKRLSHLPDTIKNEIIKNTNRYISLKNKMIPVYNDLDYFMSFNNIKRVETPYYHHQEAEYEIFINKSGDCYHQSINQKVYNNLNKQKNEKLLYLENFKPNKLKQIIYEFAIKDEKKILDKIPTLEYDYCLVIKNNYEAFATYYFIKNNKSKINKEVFNQLASKSKTYLRLQNRYIPIIFDTDILFSCNSPIKDYIKLDAEYFIKYRYSTFFKEILELGSISNK